MNVQIKASRPKNYVHNPAFTHVEQIPDVYALEGTGPCMEPLVRDGDLLVFDKSAAVASGDTVNIWFHPEHTKERESQGMLMRLVCGLPPEDVRAALIGMAVVIVDQLNPVRQFHIPAAHVLAIHKCVGFADIDAHGKAQVRPQMSPPRQPFDYELANRTEGGLAT